MEETYELTTRDTLLLLEQQLATSDFDKQTEYVPYQEFDAKKKKETAFTPTSCRDIGLLVKR